MAEASRPGAPTPRSDLAELVEHLAQQGGRRGHERTDRAPHDIGGRSISTGTGGIGDVRHRRGAAFPIVTASRCRAQAPKASPITGAAGRLAWRARIFIGSVARRISTAPGKVMAILGDQAPAIPEPDAAAGEEPARGAAAMRPSSMRAETGVGSSRAPMASTPRRPRDGGGAAGSTGVTDPTVVKRRRSTQPDAARTPGSAPATGWWSRPTIERCRQPVKPPATIAVGRLTTDPRASSTITAPSRRWKSGSRQSSVPNIPFAWGSRSPVIDHPEVQAMVGRISTGAWRPEWVQPAGTTCRPGTRLEKWRARVRCEPTPRAVPSSGGVNPAD